MKIKHGNKNIEMEFAQDVSLGGDELVYSVSVKISVAPRRV